MRESPANQSGVAHSCNPGQARGGEGRTRLHRVLTDCCSSRMPFKAHTHIPQPYNLPFLCTKARASLVHWHPSFLWPRPLSIDISSLTPRANGSVSKALLHHNRPSGRGLKQRGESEKNKWPPLYTLLQLAFIAQPPLAPANLLEAIRHSPQKQELFTNMLTVASGSAGTGCNGLFRRVVGRPTAQHLGPKHLNGNQSNCKIGVSFCCSFLSVTFEEPGASA